MQAAQPKSVYGCDAEDAVQLVAADALLAGHHQVDRFAPLVHRQVALFEDGALADGELPAAFPEAVALFAFEA